MADKPIKIDPSDYLGPDEFTRQAVERFTKTPITFTRLKGDQGKESPGPNLTNLFGYGPQLFPPTNNSQLIQVDPYAAAQGAGIPSAIQHEATHANLVNVPGIEAISQAAPGYSQLAAQIARKFGVASSDLPIEVPAYANSNEPSLNKDWIQPYIEDITQKLRAAGLGTQASQLQRIHQQGQISQ